VLTALEKLPADRFATAAEFASALGGDGSGTRRMTAARIGAQPVPTRGRRAILPAALALLGLLAGVLIGRRGGDPGSVGPADVVRATLRLGQSVQMPAIGNLRLALSPSGRQGVFVGATGPEADLWVRDLDQPDAHPLPDTRGAFAPFYSPDGRSIGFFTAASGRTTLRVIPAAGGVARTVVDDSIAPFGGGSWGDNGNIYFTHVSRGLARVNAVGGIVTPVSVVDSGQTIREHDYPEVLPGSRYALVMLWRGAPGNNHVGLIDLATGAVTDLTPGSFSRYLAPGYIVIGTGDGRLLVARFDPRAGKMLGSPIPVLQNVQTESSNGTVEFAVSATGLLAYQPAGSGGTTLIWVDRAGHQTPVDTTLTGSFRYVALSPDGGSIAIDRIESGDDQIWVKQLSTGSMTRLSFGVTGADRPVWTRDGRKVAFIATRNELRTAWMRRADGSDSLESASPADIRLDEIAFDPLGRFTLFRTEGVGEGSRKLLVLRNGVDTVPRLLLRSTADNFAMTLSPDGQWLAYVSSESGIPEVYVRPFPSVDSARFAISVGGGIEPLWRRDGKELFFRNSRGSVYATTVTTGRHFEHEQPHLLFSVDGVRVEAYFRSYDIHPDGKRFLMLNAGGSAGNDLNVIFNWRSELERLTAGQP